MGTDYTAETLTSHSVASPTQCFLGFLECACALPEVTSSVPWPIDEFIVQIICLHVVNFVREFAL